MNEIKLFCRDRRFLSLSQEFEEEGWRVTSAGEKSEEPCLLLFSPRDGEKEIRKGASLAAEGSLAVVGALSDEAMARLEECGLRVVSLPRDPSYLALNAQATAEGVLAEVIRATPDVLQDTCLLVCGYGNCGRAIARLLWLCGCQVWVRTRERSAAVAERDGFSLFPDTALPRFFDGVINTVPAPIFTPEFLSALPQNAAFFQVASGFSGLCAETLTRQGIRFFPLHGLPALVAPETEKRAIRRILDPLLKKERKPN